MAKNWWEDDKDAADWWTQDKDASTPTQSDARRAEPVEPAVSTDTVREIDNATVDPTPQNFDTRRGTMRSGAKPYVAGGVETRVTRDVLSQPAPLTMLEEAAGAGIEAFR